MSEQENKTYSGPLFIVGMPRSGTKLLRELCNQHPLISIPTAESHFIPYLYRRIGNKSMRGGRWRRAEKIICETNFYNIYRKKGLNPQWKKWYRKYKSEDLAFLIELLIRYYGPKDIDDREVIWGDKTPAYLLHVKLLKKLFPEAKFLHIIRDPRDYALSINKTWGRDMIIAAENWRRSVAACREAGMQIGNDYLEIYYENLISAPRETVQKITDFLNIEFQESMLILEKSVENYGDAKESLQIESNNRRKFYHAMPRKKIQRIESLTYDLIKDMPYKLVFEHAEGSKLSGSQHFLHKFKDAFFTITFHIKDKGLWRGLRYFMKGRKISSWRQASD
mgnify:CR=1 FL=1